jgi:hypothetical protein
MKTKKPLFDDDDSFLINDKKTIIFDEAYLIKRGYCCGNGCVHCPFGYKNVLDEHKKMAFQKQQKITKDGK